MEQIKGKRIDSKRKSPDFITKSRLFFGAEGGI
jgi:hypothetical protein